MAEPPQPDDNLPLRPSAVEALVRRLARDSQNVRWRAATYRTHAESRMLWRGITDAMMFEVLRTGYLKGEIELGKNQGEIKVKMAKRLAGHREIGVVTLVIDQQRLFVKTVEWEDPR